MSEASEFMTDWYWRNQQLVVLDRWAAEGLVNTVNGQPEREFPFWFLATGILTLKSPRWRPRHRIFAWSLFALTVVTVRRCR